MVLITSTKIAIKTTATNTPMMIARGIQYFLVPVSGAFDSATFVCDCDKNKTTETKVTAAYLQTVKDAVSGSDTDPKVIVVGEPKE